MSDYQAPDFDALKTIVVPCDLSERSKAAIPYALQLAAHTGAQVVAVHVSESDAFPLIYKGVLSEEEFHERVGREVAKRLAALREAHDGRIEVRQRRGMPSTEIVAEAQERGAELIVMTSHGRSGFSHVLVGSVAERVLRASSCPVVVLPTRA